MQGFLAYITPVQSGGPVDPGYGQPAPPEQIWGGRPPSGSWPGWGPPPANPPGIWGPPGPFPTPPIANVPGLPPTTNPPGFGPHPSHPIVHPQPPQPPGGGGGQPGTPTPPINLPPEPAPPGYKWEMHYAPQLNGWIWVLVPAPTTPPEPPGYNPPSGGNVPQPVAPKPATK